MKLGIPLLFFLLASSLRVLAWDPIGHMIVSQTAYDNLTPKAKTAVDQSLARFNEKNQTSYTFVTAGCWMDDIRGTDKEFSPWHYIELPENREADPFPVAWQVNVLWAIRHCQAILAGEKTDPKVDSDQALVMLLHLVGDVHQPHHTMSLNNDMGGNRVMVINLQDAMVAAFPRRKNLHYFWDSSYRRTVRDGLVVETLTEPPTLPSNPSRGHAASEPLAVKHAKTIAETWQAEKFPADGTPEDWVRESHAQAYDQIYGTLPGGKNANPVTLDEEYVSEARTLANQKLVQAGHRLAKTLNTLYK